MTRLVYRFGAVTRAIKGIDGDVKLNRALWVMAENMLQLAS
ncbi:hypothetical protein DJ55_3625 [Yersinia pseudotuberculosis]|nr:hypothetical protein DJ55_3625 [Yersinia pseudotuberculosis]